MTGSLQGLSKVHTLDPSPIQRSGITSSARTVQMGSLTVPASLSAALLMRTSSTTLIFMAA